MTITDTESLIETTIRCCEHESPFMPNATRRIMSKIGSRAVHATDPNWDVFLDELAALINGEKLTMKKLEQLGVTMETLVGWQWWMIYRDEMI